MQAARMTPNLRPRVNRQSTGQLYDQRLDKCMNQHAGSARDPNLRRREARGSMYDQSLDKCMNQHSGSTCDPHLRQREARGSMYDQSLDKCMNQRAGSAYDPQPKAAREPAKHGAACMINVLTNV